MPFKTLFLLAICFATRLSLYAQYIEQGNFNNWDFGPKSVHGNLRLNRTSARTYYHIEKTDGHTVNIKKVNPAGVVENTTMITFAGGLLRSVDEMNQWGEHYNQRNFTEIKKDVFKVTDFTRGTNSLLPCKYATYTYQNEMLAEIRYYSSSGTLAENKNGLAVVQYQRYDDSVRFAMTREIAYFDKNNLPVNSKAADYHKVAYNVDEHDNRVLESYFDPKGAPATIRRSAVASIRMFYDDDNNMIRSEFYGTDNKPAVNFSGIAGNEYKFLNGYQMEIIRFDSAKQVARPAASGDGIAIIKISYDSAGNKISEGFYNETGSPINDHTGVHAIYFQYSPDNMLTRTSYFNLAEKPSLNRDKIHSIDFLRDNLGRIVEQSYYGLMLEPVKDFTDEVYITRFKYDTNGRRTFLSFWKDSLTRMSRWSGSYAQAYSFDLDGQTTAITFLDKDEKLLKGKDGASMIQFVFNENGTEGERQFLHENKLIMRASGVTNGYGSIKYIYDDGGRVADLRFFDNVGKPVDATIDFDTTFLAHRVTFKYLGNRIIEQSFYPISGDHPVRTVDCLKSDFLSVTGINIGRKNVE